MENYSTFTDGIITFEYPDVFEERPEPKEIISGSSSQVTVGFLSFNGVIEIDIVKNIKSISPTKARDSTENEVRTLSTGQILSRTTVNNPYGVIAEKSIHSIMEPRTKAIITYNSIFFRANGMVYAITVFGLDSDYELIEIVADFICDTLRKK